MNSEIEKFLDMAAAAAGHVEDRYREVAFQEVLRAALRGIRETSAGEVSTKSTRSQVADRDRELTLTEYAAAYDPELKSMVERVTCVVAYGEDVRESRKSSRSDILGALGELRVISKNVPRDIGRATRQPTPYLHSVGKGESGESEWELTATGRKWADERYNADAG